MIKRTWVPWLVIAATATMARTALASELSYTFVDFQAVSTDTAAEGTLVPVPSQIVKITTENGDGISISGSLAIANRFYFGGAFQSSIIDVAAVITNPLGTTNATDTFDLVRRRLGFGYKLETGENLDFVLELSLDGTEYDFGSFAGENFDMKDDGLGASVGFRWNPRPAFELFSFAHYSTVSKAILSTREFDSDTSTRVGMMWYFFEDLGLGVDFLSAEIDTVAISMRFSFGDLRLQR